MVWRLALGLALWFCSAQASAQLAAVAQEPAGFREQLRRGNLLLELGDLLGAEGHYGAAYRLWPSAEASWSLGRVACARSNFGDCSGWLRAALATQLVPLSAEQQDAAHALLRVANDAQQRVNTEPRAATVVVLSAITTLTENERPMFTPAEPDAQQANRATLWTVASIVAVAALAGVIVGVTAQPGR